MSTFVTGLRSKESESELARELASVVRPPGVSEPDILLGTDHSGDPAVHIIYPVSTRIKLTKARIGALLQFSEAVHDRIRELQMDRVPYVRFNEANR